MASDHLLVHIERQYGVITLDGIDKDPSTAHSPFYIDFLNADPKSLDKQRVFLDLSHLKISEALPYIEKSADLSLNKTCKAQVFVLLKSFTSSPAWVIVCKRAKTILFLNGKGSIVTGNQPTALVHFAGEIKGSPMVNTINLDTIDVVPEDFDRKRHLYSKRAHLNGY